MEARLKTELWVKALIRRCEIEAVPAIVVRRGDKTAGVALVKVNLLDGRAMLYSQARGIEGQRIWLAHGISKEGHWSEAEADAYIDRQVKVDPDVWVIEIEDRQGRHFLTEPVE